MGDARVVALTQEDNAWVCPPLAVLQQSIVCFMEKRALGTVVVPDWEGQAWSVYLRARAEHSHLLARRGSRPTIVDSASRKVTAHHANKWQFRAYLVDNRDGRLEAGVPRTPAQLCSARSIQGTKEMMSRMGKEGRKVVQKKELRVISLFSGMGSIPWLLDRMGVSTRTWEMEIDPVARSVAELRAPGAVQLTPHNVWEWCSEEGIKRLVALKPHLLVAGFPCQSVSTAAPQGQGLEGKSGIFEALSYILRRLREADVLMDFIIECTDFSKRHPADFEYVSRSLGTEPVVLCAGDISACFRRRAYWTSFELPELEYVEVDPNSVLDAGRTTWWKRLPTIVASGQISWNTREVVEDQWGRRGPLSINEMERAMEYDTDFTEVEGARMKDRFRLIGSAFHAGVLRWILLAYISSKAMKAWAMRGSVDQRWSQPFEEREDGPKRIDWTKLRAGEHSASAHCKGTSEGLVKLRQFFKRVGKEGKSRKAQVQKERKPKKEKRKGKSKKKVALPPEGGSNSTAGKSKKEKKGTTAKKNQQGAAATQKGKKRVAHWRGFIRDEKVKLQTGGSLWDLMAARWEKSPALLK